MPAVTKSSETNKLSFKEAANRALSHFTELYPQLAANNLMLE
jgi:hypothetical protein